MKIRCVSQKKKKKKKKREIVRPITDKNKQFLSAKYVVFGMQSTSWQQPKHAITNDIDSIHTQSARYRIRKPKTEQQQQQ